VRTRQGATSGHGHRQIGGCYILLNRTVGERLPGLRRRCGRFRSALPAPRHCCPVAHQPTVGALLCALAAGVLSSAVPFLADLLAAPGPRPFLRDLHERQPAICRSDRHARPGTLVRHRGWPSPRLSPPTLSPWAPPPATRRGTPTSSDEPALAPDPVRASSSATAPYSPFRAEAILRDRRLTQADVVHGAGTAPICCRTPRRSGWPRSPTIRPWAR